MPFFSKVFKPSQHPDTAPRSKSELSRPQTRFPQQQTENISEDAWQRTHVSAEEVHELLHVCTLELKSRALDTPFLLLPFRPDFNLNLAQSFIRNFFKRSHGAHEVHRLQQLYYDLRLVEPMGICSIAKWCWSRLSGGVVTWNTYELFRSGELESHMTRNAFDTFIPLSVESEARRQIVFDFFDLLCAIAAHAKGNGLGGRKLSRLAGWWAFDHIDEGKGFDGGYRSWSSAANATSHLFFAYLRSRSPDPATDTTGISHIPRSLQALVAQTDYPPETPASLQAWTARVVMLVDSVSPTPYALLRRANQFDYRHEDSSLQRFGRYEEPLDVLTIECCRVLDCISSTHTISSSSSASPKISSWDRFEDSGFSDIARNPDHVGDSKISTSSRAVSDSSLLTGRSGSHQVVRPTTPSWADFMSSGFSTNSLDRRPASLLVSPSVMLPPLGESTPPTSPQGTPHDFPSDDDRYAELASISHLHLDETFWWVWMASLASEEPPRRKAVFGRCAFVETKITSGRWLILEEQIKAATEESQRPEAHIAVKKSRFGLGKMGRTRRKPSEKQDSEFVGTLSSPVQAATSAVGSEEQARVQAVAVAIVKKHAEEARATAAVRRGRLGEDSKAKTTSVLTMQPIKLSDVAPALQWARNFDKSQNRAKYLGELTPTNGFGGPAITNKTLPTSPAHPAKIEERDLPAPPPPLPTKDATKAIGIQTMTPPSSPPTALRSTKVGSPASRGVSTEMSLPKTPIKIDRKPVDSRHDTLIRELGIPSPLSSNPSPQVLVHDETLDRPKATTTPPKLRQKSQEHGASPLVRPKVFQKSSTGSVRGLVNIFNRRKGNVAQVSSNPKPLDSPRRVLQIQTAFADDTLFPRGETTARSPLLDIIPVPSPPVQLHNHRSANRNDFEPRVYEPNHFYQSPPQSPTSFEMRDANMHFRNFSSGGDEDHDFSTLTMQEPSRWTQSSSSNFRTRAAALLAPSSRPYLDPTQAAYAETSDYITPSESPEPQMTSDCDSRGEYEYEDDNISTRSVRIAHQPKMPVVVNKPSLSHDRWAQIRKHASERRLSQDNFHGAYLSSRPSMSATGFTEHTDDTDVSGIEESIEDRVARVKARVAALTNNQPSLIATTSRFAG